MRKKPLETIDYKNFSTATPCSLLWSCYRYILYNFAKNKIKYRKINKYDEGSDTDRLGLVCGTEGILEVSVILYWNFKNNSILASYDFCYMDGGSDYILNGVYEITFSNFGEYLAKIHELNQFLDKKFNNLYKRKIEEKLALIHDEILLVLNKLTRQVGYSPLVFENTHKCKSRFIVNDEVFVDLFYTITDRDRAAVVIFINRFDRDVRRVTSEGIDLTNDEDIYKMKEKISKTVEDCVSVLLDKSLIN